MAFSETERFFVKWVVVNRNAVISSTFNSNPRTRSQYPGPSSDP